MLLPSNVVLACLFIFLARICDVSLGTLRTVAVINGRRGVAWVLGFFEVLLWVLVVSQVIRMVDPQHWYYAVAYALGFASGNFVGITIERRIAHGEQVVRVFTRRGMELARHLREDGYGVTEFDGRGKDGPVGMLFIETRRRRVSRLLARARELDPGCFYIVDDVRIRSVAGGQAQRQGK
ncbi:MAG TPA: DUF2179 domain-containing protein [Phycisphaerales bacterium]|nr:DUF2179 domain-containing protein [Phycisphaerales bacterium]